MKYQTNAIEVSKKVTADILDFIDLENYSHDNYADVLREELENVAYAEIQGNLREQTDRLVEGGFFRVYNHDIYEFLKSLSLKDSVMQRAEEDPLSVYQTVVYHAVKRYLGR